MDENLDQLIKEIGMVAHRHGLTGFSQFSPSDSLTSPTSYTLIENTLREFVNEFETKRGDKDLQAIKQGNTVAGGLSSRLEMSQTMIDSHFDTIYGLTQHSLNTIANIVPFEKILQEQREKRLQEMKEKLDKEKEILLQQMKKELDRINEEHFIKTAQIREKYSFTPQQDEK